MERGLGGEGHNYFQWRRKEGQRGGWEGRAIIISVEA